ncbi:MAG: DinB family protein, partial [Planctomycetes bacterium]|nr:DinB family protein [Planctomycetota bacterium]
QDPLKVQRATPKKLETLTHRLTPAQLRRRPAPKKWSIAEILAHLAETEIVVGWRLRQALTKSGGPVQAYDQDAWASAGRYAKRDPKASLALFRALRECNLTLLRGLSKQQWNCFHMHEERGKETVARTVSMIAGHDLNHLGQVERLRKALRK